MIRTVALSVLALVLSVIVGVSAFAQAKTEQDPRINQPAPSFELTGTDGKSHKISDFKGKIVVIHFQGVQCPWERAYQPILNKVANEHPDVVFLGINSNKAESMDDIKALQTKENIPYVILKDPGNKVADLYGAQTTPHMYIIDKEGKVVYHGGIEKAPANMKAVGKSSEQYLVPVVAALKEGKPLPATVTVPKGCTIKRQ
jgi:peroxiredoxin